MNENFKSAIKESKITMYELAAKAAVPYTTINKLMNDKLDINKISAEALYKIAIVLKTDMNSLLNNVQFLNKATGHSGKIKYHWISSPQKNDKIRFTYNGENVEVDLDEKFVKPEHREYFDLFAQMAVERYVKRAKFEEEVKMLMRR